MLEYRIIWNEKALKDISKLDKQAAIRIKNKVNQHLCKAPQKLGEPMKGSFAGLHRYRVGDYRVIYKIQDEMLIISIIRIGHRKEVYEE